MPCFDVFLRVQRTVPSSEAMRDKLARTYESYYNYQPYAEDAVDPEPAQPSAHDPESVTIGLVPLA